MRSVVGFLLAFGLLCPDRIFAVSSTFDSDLDGWFGSDIRFVDSIGNPAGSLEFQETYNANGDFASAPAEFLGDWSAADGTGSITFEHRVSPDVPPAYWLEATNREIRLSGPGGSATWLGALPSFNSSFVTITAPLEEASWTVDSGTWLGLLSNVTSFQLRVDHFNDLFGAERTQFDNIVVSGVPEPSDALLLAFGLAGLAAWRRQVV